MSALVESDEEGSPIPQRNLGFNFPSLKAERNNFYDRFVNKLASTFDRADSEIESSVGSDAVYPSEIQFLRAEQSYRMKKFANLKGISLGSEDYNEDYLRALFHPRDDVLGDFLLPKVFSQPLQPNLIYVVRNIFQFNPVLLNRIFRLPALFFTCPEGKACPNDNFKLRRYPRNGKWLVDRSGFPIMRPNKIVIGMKRTFQFSPRNSSVVPYLLDMYRVNNAFKLADGALSNYKPGWTLAIVYGNPLNLELPPHMLNPQAGLGSDEQANDEAD